MNVEDVEALEADGIASSVCSAFQRRKLKCDDNVNGCSTCRKSDIPCFYTPYNSTLNSTGSTLEARRKPHGPHNKGITPREKEVEHVIELLKEKCNELEAQVRVFSSQHTSPGDSHGATAKLSYSRCSLQNLTEISPQEYAML